MFNHIVHDTGPITLVGGGEATPEDLQKALTLAPTCVAADGGAETVLAQGITPAAVIGDFDSVAPETLRAIPTDRQHRIAEQDSTDFEKALSRIDAPLVIGVGFLGRRVDHQMAALHTLTRYAARPCILIGAHELVCLAPPRLTLPTVAGDVVSLFPLGATRGSSRGLEWPLDGLTLAPLGQIGTSNRATGPVSLRFDAPHMLLFLPRRLMSAVAAALCAPDAARWPAPSE